MKASEVAELLSLGSTASLLVVAVVVFRIYCPDLRKLFTQAAIPTTVLRAGIALCVISTILDNSYWALPWGSKYFESSNSDIFMNFGIFMNLPFRILLTMMGLWFHVKADAMSRGNDVRLSRTLTCMILAFVITTGILFIIKTFE